MLSYVVSDFYLAPSDVAKSPAVDINGIDWMAQQNGGAFDPVLFGDYRDPQDNVLNSNNAFGDFFNDAFTQDFGTPYYTGEAPPKKDLLQEIEVQKNATPSTIMSEEEKKKYLPCDKVWLVHCVLVMAVVLSLLKFTNFQGPHPVFRESAEWGGRHG